MKKMKLFPILIAVLILFVFVVPVSAGLLIKPANAKLVVGGNQQFTATDQDGSPTPEPIKWYSDNNSVGTISAAGVFSATAAGTSTIAASSGEVSGTAPVTVIGLETSSGNIQNIIAVNLDTLQTPLPIGSNLPYGIFSYQISGIPEKSSVNIIFTAPDDLPVWTTYLKYNYKTKTWNTITPDEINGKRVKITLTDGGPRDEDGIANGVIDDPGGINIGQIQTPGIPEFPTVALPIIAVIGLVFLFHRRKNN